MPSLRAGLVVIADRYCWTPMARAEARGVDGAWLDALFAFVPAPGRGAVPRRRCRGVAGPPRRRSGSIRGGCRPRPVGGPAGELPAVRRAPLRLFRPVCRARAASPASGRRTRSSRSASACSARRMRSSPSRADARPGGRTGQPVSRMTRIVHLSDFHFDGSPELRRALRSLVDSAIARDPDLVVVTGDLSADGRPAELDEVALELARFGADPAGRHPRQSRPRAGRWVRPGEARPLPVDSDLDYFLALEPALTLGFDETGRDDAATLTCPAALTRKRPGSPGSGASAAGIAARRSTSSRSTRRRGSAPRRWSVAARQLRRARPGALRVFALHHGLLPGPGPQAPRRRPDAIARATCWPC